MIDTVKLSLDVNPDIFVDNKNLEGFSSSHIIGAGRSRNVAINPKISAVQEHGYLPRLTLRHKTTTHGSFSHQLFVEFSAPKLLFGNNLEELTDNDLEPLLQRLQETLHLLTGYRFDIDTLRNANVSTWHVSKNFVFRDYTTCLAVIEALSKADMSKAYDIQRTTYKHGEALQFHTNTLDVTFYDKVAELRQSKKSPKRSVEKYATKQIELLDVLEKLKPLDVLRFEIRLSNRTRVKSTFRDLGEWTFESLFSASTSQALLKKHWDTISNSLDFISLDTDKPWSVFQNVINENPSIKTAEALRLVGCLVIANQVGARTLQAQITKTSGQHVWYRIRPSIRGPTKQRYKSFIQITNDLEGFTPVRISDLQ